MFFSVILYCIFNCGYLAFNVCTMMVVFYFIAYSIGLPRPDVCEERGAGEGEVLRFFLTGRNLQEKSDRY